MKNIFNFSILLFLILFSGYLPGISFCQELDKSMKTLVSDLEEKNVSEIKKQLKRLIERSEYYIRQNGIRIKDVSVWLTIRKSFPELNNDYKTVENICSKFFMEEMGISANNVSDDVRLWDEFGSKLPSLNIIRLNVAEKNDFILYITLTLKYINDRKLETGVISEFSIETTCFLLKKVPQENVFVKAKKNFDESGSVYSSFKLKEPENIYGLIETDKQKLDRFFSRYQVANTDPESMIVQKLVKHKMSELQDEDVIKIYFPKTKKVWVWKYVKNTYVHPMIIDIEYFSDTTPFYVIVEKP